MSGLALYSRRVLVENELNEATIFIDNKSIHKVIPGPQEQSGYEKVDYGDLVIMPGLIDSHVHINEPGRTNWEGFETATKAAAVGGITTLVDMPLNSSPVTTNKTGFDTKLASAKDKLYVNCGFWGGYIGQDLKDLENILRAGTFGIKVFLIQSGIDEFPHVSEIQLRQAIPIIKKYGRPILAHCELALPHEDANLLEDKPTDYYAYLKSRPKTWEDKAIGLMINLCREFNIRTHVVHLSSSNSLLQIRNAKSEGIPLTVETCPHYLYFEAEQIKKGSTLHKCAPPIREYENKQKLWDAVQEGLIDFIVTDHSPAPKELKSLESGDFSQAWGGIAGLQFSLSAVWTKARERGINVPRISNLMSRNVAEFLDLDKKGKIKAGYDADLCVWDPESTVKIKSEMIQHRHKFSPYVGEKLNGIIRATYVGGKLIFADGNILLNGQGSILLSNILA